MAPSEVGLDRRCREFTSPVSRHDSEEPLGEICWLMALRHFKQFAAVTKPPSMFFHDVDKDLIHRSMTMSVEICVFRMGRSHGTKTGNNLASGSCSAKRLLATKCESSVTCSLVKQQTSHRTGFLPHLLRESRHTPCVCSWIYSSESVVVFARERCHVDVDDQGCRLGCADKPV